MSLALVAAAKLQDGQALPPQSVAACTPPQFCERKGLIDRKSTTYDENRAVNVRKLLDY
jgi:hypothetical protein